MFRPGVSAIRVNHRRNVVAADATTQEYLQQLMAVTALHGIPVTARKPPDHRTGTGYFHGVDREPEDATMLLAIISSVPVLPAAREGRTVTPSFDGPLPSQNTSPCSIYNFGEARTTMPPAVPSVESFWPC
ncbi:hypothetical protein MRX96_039595 [Rhipicephalus microplus]